MSFDFAFSCSPQIQQIPDLRALTVLLSFSLPGVRSTSPRKGQPCLSTQASSLFIYHPPPFSHSTSLGLLVTQQYSRSIISSPNLSQASVPHIRFLPCHILLDFSQDPHTQKYRSGFLIFFPTLLLLHH